LYVHPLQHFQPTVFRHRVHRLRGELKDGLGVQQLGDVEAATARHRLEEVGVGQGRRRRWIRSFNNVQVDMLAPALQHQVHVGAVLNEVDPLEHLQVPTLTC
jgi:hypothetical protein